MTPNAKSTTPLALPPFGYLVWHQHEGALSRDCPAKWNVEKGEWQNWFDRVLDVIAQNVWPVYRNGTWVPSPAAENAVAMTLADLAAIREFRKSHFLRPIGTTGRYHADCFVAEDLSDGSGWLSSFGAYCPGLVEPSFSIKYVFEHGIFDYAHRYLPERFKLHFQRPRPYQTALILGPAAGRELFTHDTATSANTPSLISGHGVQALLVGCVAFEAISGDDALTDDNRSRIQNWMTDIGDRRVMAGVHYPTDSLASWIVAAEIVDYLFSDSSVRQFLREAIENSLLYKFLETRSSETEYVRPWQCLLQILAKPSSKAE
jgi:hypothetical protein